MKRFAIISKSFRNARHRFRKLLETFSKTTISFHPKRNFDSVSEIDEGERSHFFSLRFDTFQKNDVELKLSREN